MSIVHLQTPEEISRHLCISERSARRYIDQFEQTGDIEPKSHHHGPPKLLEDFGQLVLLRLILQNPGIYLHEIQAELLTLYGVSVACSTLCKTLRFMGCSRQVIKHISVHRSDELRAKFMAEISIYDPCMIIWIDETGCDLRNSTRKRGYSIRGMTPRDFRIVIRGVRYSVVPVMSMEGILDIHIIEGTMNGDRFQEFLKSTVVPLLQPFNYSNPHSVVVMDNASIHHTEGVADLIENQAGARLIYLPPYSPDLNPAEEVFSQVKSVMKQNDQISSAPRTFLAMAFNMVTKEDCIQYITHSGYL